MSRPLQSGLTLAEVLIALLIFSFIAAASVYALRLGVESRDQLSAADSALKKIQIARLLIKEDLAQVADRPVRDEFGIVNAAAFAGGQVTFGRRAADDEKVLMSFVRSGWLNPNAQAPRSALQRVEYIFKNNALIRRSRVYLDETENIQTIDRILFDDLEDATAAFVNGEFRGELQWADAWPVSSAQLWPEAVALTLYKTDEEPLRQLFWIGALETQL